MVKRIFLLALIAASSAAFVYAQTKMTIPVKSTPADSGQQMYVSYCASCHGFDGRGNGPTAAALATPPADLTKLSKNNNGVFPGVHVIAVLKFGAENAAHGSKTMPIWGPALGKVDNSHGSLQDADAALRISNIAKYIETLQAN